MTHIQFTLRHESVVLNMNRDHGYITTTKLRFFWVIYSSADMQHLLSQLPWVRTPEGLRAG